MNEIDKFIEETNKDDLTKFLEQFLPNDIEI